MTTQKLHALVLCLSDSVHNRDDETGTCGNCTARHDDIAVHQWRQHWPHHMNGESASIDKLV